MRAAQLESMSAFRGGNVAHRALDAAWLALLVGALIVTVFAWSSTAAQSTNVVGPPEAVAQFGD